MVQILPEIPSFGQYLAQKLIGGAEKGLESGRKAQAQALKSEGDLRNLILKQKLIGNRELEKEAFKAQKKQELWELTEDDDLGAYLGQRDASDLGQRDASEGIETNGDEGDRPRTKSTQFDELDNQINSLENIKNQKIAQAKRSSRGGLETKERTRILSKESDHIQNQISNLQQQKSSLITQTSQNNIKNYNDENLFLKKQKASSDSFKQILKASSLSVDSQKSNRFVRSFYNKIKKNIPGFIDATDAQIESSSTAMFLESLNNISGSGGKMNQFLEQKIDSGIIGPTKSKQANQYILEKWNFIADMKNADIEAFREGTRNINPADYDSSVDEKIEGIKQEKYAKISKEFSVVFQQLQEQSYSDDELLEGRGVSKSGTTPITPRMEKLIKKQKGKDKNETYKWLYERGFVFSK